MYKKVTVLFFLVLCSTVTCLAQQAKDPFYSRKMTEKELVQLIRTTPLSSRKHTNFPVVTFPLKQVALREYSAIWRRSPRNPWASLRYGRVLQDYVRMARYYPELNMRRGDPKTVKLMTQVGQLLQDAVRKMPNVSEANTAYGWYLVDHENILRQGLAYLEKGVELNPKSSGARALLAEAQINPHNNLYNPLRAERELLRSVQLNPKSSYSQYLLLRLYFVEKQYQKALKAMNDYCALVTPEMAKATREYWQKDIEKGIAKNKAKQKS